jgi:hypothetical protein
MKTNHGTPMPARAETAEHQLALLRVTYSEREAQLDAAIAARDRLARALETAAQDTTRMDWLEARAMDVYPNMDDHFDYWSFQRDNESLREAIDRTRATLTGETTP